MSKKAKKDEKTLKDHILMLASIIAGLLALVTVIPKVPWRRAAMFPGFHQRFGVLRDYSLFTLSNKYGQGVSWTKMRADTCKKMQEFNGNNPLFAAIGTVATSVTGAGGAIGGCFAWQVCKEHVAARCSAYGMMTIVGLVGLVFNVVGGICLLLIPMMMNMEPSPQGKKKSQQKKLEDARKTTMLVAVVGFVLPLITLVAWTVSSDSMFKTLKKNGMYPYGAASAGIFLNGAAVFLAAIGALCAYFRTLPEKDKKPTEETEEMDQEFVNDGGLPGMDPLMGGLAPPPLGY